MDAYVQTFEFTPFSHLDLNKYRSLSRGKFGSTIDEWPLLFHEGDDVSALRCLVVLRIQMVKYNQNCKKDICIKPAPGQLGL